MSIASANVRIRSWMTSSRADADVIRTDAEGLYPVIVLRDLAAMRRHFGELASPVVRVVDGGRELLLVQDGIHFKATEAI